MTTPDRPENVAQAVKTLGDVPLVLWAAREAVRLFWSICLKRWPELR